MSENFATAASEGATIMEVCKRCGQWRVKVVGGVWKCGVQAQWRLHGSVGKWRECVWRRGDVCAELCRVSDK